MRLLCDENIKSAIFNLLEQEGYDVTRVQDKLEIGFDDRDIVKHCLEQNRVIVTNDDDFLVVDQHGGVLFLDEQRTPPRPVVEAIKRIEKDIGTEELFDTVVHIPDGLV